MSKLRLYNTLTRSKEEFLPIDPAHVRLYVCGPTVYDFAHIGNARPLIVFDVLFRLLRHLYGPVNVTYVRNITDVDDKINDRAARDFPDLPLNDAIRQVTEKTANQFFDDVKALGCLEPTQQPRATENIAEMIAIIEKLIARGHAYVALGEVLFEVASMPDYGKLSRRPLDEQQAGARVAVEAHKRNPADFVLWKMSSLDEPGWESPWGRGRPGWHIECSAMSRRHLIDEMAGKIKCDPADADVFDIHGGGIDLIFPHHENEIAQSRCAFGSSRMANVWMHNGFLQVEGEKMSKSSGNFVTINELLETRKFGGGRWDGSVARLAMLSAHYRQPIDWTESRMIEAISALQSFRQWTPAAPVSDKQHAPFLEALLDDLNTPRAISELHGLVKQMRDQRDVDHSERMDMLANALSLLGFENVSRFGAGVEFRLASSIDYAKVELLIAARTAARAAKNFVESDQLRDQLAAMGVQLKDAKDPVTGEMTTTWEVKP